VVVLRRKERRTTHKLTALNGEKSTHITMLAFVSASGMKIPPLFIYPNKRMSAELVAGCRKFDPECLLAMSDNGWITADIYALAFQHFIKHLPPASERGHVLLICDGHESHVQLRVAREAMAHKVDVALFVSHTSHLVQPLDRGPFGVFKGKSNKSFAVAAGKQTVLKEHVPELLKDAYEESFTPENIKKAFYRVGLHPWRGIAAIDPKEFKAAEAVQAVNGDTSALLNTTLCIEDFCSEAVAKEAEHRARGHRAAMTALEESNCRLQAALQYHAAIVGMKAVRPHQVDAQTEQRPQPQKKRKANYLRPNGKAMCLTIDSWVEEMEAFEKEQLEKAEATEEAKKLREANKRKKAELEALKRPCTKVMASGVRAGQLCGKPALPGDNGAFLCGQHNRHQQVAAAVQPSPASALLQPLLASAPALPQPVGSAPAHALLQPAPALPQPDAGCMSALS